MTRHANQEAIVSSSIVVNAPVARAFAVFTEGIGTWFPREYNLLGVELAERVFEPRVGGRIIDRGVDGSVLSWARVLIYEPPNRVVFAWQISPQWQIEESADGVSEVDVRFISEGEGRTRVELQHRNLDRHGEGWDRVRDELNSDRGWPGCLRRFAEKAAE
jgi:uncharacterized protein YndB with AHSA1/START domain